MIGSYLGSNREYPAVGLAFGLEPIAETLKSKQKIQTPTKVFLLPIQTQKQTLKIAQEFEPKRFDEHFHFEAIS